MNVELAAHDYEWAVHYGHSYNDRNYVNCRK